MLWEIDFSAIREGLQVHILSRMGQDGGRTMTSIVTTALMSSALEGLPKRFNHTWPYNCLSQ